ncbi:MAG: hypothetical protein NTX37_06890 [Burkholderiales bacterium]|jgi:hypothetical protein|nr:hypothetical protein [Burkholderiales bacterium]
MTAKGKRITKSVLYKRVHFSANVPGETLKSLVEEALKRYTTLGQRRMNISPDASTPVYHVISSPHCEPDGFVFGALMTYTPGMDPLYLVDDADAVEVLIEKLSIPHTEDGKRREVLESMMYFGIFGDHLVLMQSQALKAPQLEAYLRWLLHDSGTLAKNRAFQLIDTPSKAVREKMERGRGVKSITLNGEVVRPPGRSGEQASLDFNDAESAHDTASVSVASSTAAEGNRWLEFMKSLIGPSRSSKIDFGKLDSANIEMSVVLKYKRSTTEEGQELMDSLGSVFRHTDDVDAKLMLKDGSIIRGAQLKLNGIVGVTAYDGQLSAQEVYEEIRGWLLGKITSDEMEVS